MGLKKIENSYMREGKIAHRTMQDHVSNKVFDERLKSITTRFPIVEEQDQDPRTHFVVKINDEYSVHGYKDADDPENKRFGEFKFSSSPWGMTKFYNLMQWRIYALSGDYTEAIFVTGTRDLKKLATFSTPILPKHREEALKWIWDSIKIIESGDFDPRPSDRFCGYISCPYCK